MKALCSLIIVLNVIGLVNCLGQEINWKSSKNWKLYNIHNMNGFRYSIDTLQHFKHIDLDTRQMKIFMDNVLEWPTDKSSLWMGLFIATCETEDNKLRKIMISSYGGFFYDEATKRYYEVPIKLRSSWYEILNEASKKMIYN